MKLKCLPVQVHYYQPIPDLQDLEKKKIWEKVNMMGGIQWDPLEQVNNLKQISEKYGSECKWPYKKESEPTQFYLENDNFSFGCAAGLHCMIRNYKPHRIIEIGSGNSSFIIRDAIRKNSVDGMNNTKVSDN